MNRRGPKPRPPIQAEHLIGSKYLPLLQSHLGQLRRLYPHPNRLLFYDDVVLCYLLAFFNPTLRSLRCIEDASQLPAFNRFLHVQAVCKSTLSEANALFDPHLLQGLIQSLQAQVPHLPQQDSTLAQLLEQVRLFDGSYFRVAAEVQWALHQPRPDGRPMGQVRLDCQFCLARGCPLGLSLHGDDGLGEGAAALEQIQQEPIPQEPIPPERVEPGRIYLFDSGVVKFALLQAILQRQSHFLCQLREHVSFQPQHAQPLSEADRAAGVQSDQWGHLSSTHSPPSARLREIRLTYTDRQGERRSLRLLTDLQELPAHRVAELYRYRWPIELFFRWLKVQAHFRHLTSHSPQGVQLSFYVALIAILLLCLHTQRPLSKYGYNLLALVAAGYGQLEDILPILARRERERARERQRQAQKRAAKKQA